jgi:hypothetical protein
MKVKAFFALQNKLCAAAAVIKEKSQTDLIYFAGAVNGTILWH